MSVTFNPAVASERVRSRGGARGSTRRGAMQSAARQHAALAQRVSGRMTKGRSKMTVMREVVCQPFYISGASQLSFPAI